jgi:hypothetical protein
VVTDAPLEQVLAAVRERLSAFKVPTRWLLTDDTGLVPTSATGKLDKTGLHDLLQTDAVASGGAHAAADAVASGGAHAAGTTHEPEEHDQ